MENYNHPSNDNLNQSNERTGSQADRQSQIDWTSQPSQSNTRLQHNYTQYGNENEASQCPNNANPYSRANGSNRYSNYNNHEKNNARKYAIAVVGGVALASALFFGTGTIQGTNVISDIQEKVVDITEGVNGEPTRSMWATIRSADGGSTQADDNPAAIKYLEDHGDGATVEDVVSKAGVNNLADANQNEQALSDIASSVQRTLSDEGYEEVWANMETGAETVEGQPLTGNYCVVGQGAYYLRDDDGKTQYRCAVGVVVDPSMGDKFKIAVVCQSFITNDYFCYEYSDCSEIPTSDTLYKLIGPQLDRI